MMYVIANDDSGHYYVIPKDQTDNWNKWIGTEAWNLGILPWYAVAINGSYARVSFNEYEIV